MKKLDYNSKIKDIYRNPIGRDILNKLLLQMNKGEILITNIIVRNLKLKNIKWITKKVVAGDFYDTFLNLLNSEQDLKISESTKNEPKWWKEAVFYQIYPRSFMDSNGDGIGDLRGLISKLDYLMDLGINAIWLSPIYDSPNDDNGYDIRDYHKIMKEFGSMEDFDLLLDEIHARGMRLIMDLVINHTSDEHAWFVSALEEQNSIYKDYYHFVKNKDNNPPNNWTSFFSGSAWNYYEEQDEWALHLFSKKQMDLNWDNENTREDIYKMVRWWLEKGVDGFRLDVINYISKKSSIDDGNEQIGKLMGYYGIEHYFYGPKLHTYLHELREKAFEPYNAFSIGQTPGVGIEVSKRLTADYRKELDMIFSFDHLETPGHVRFDDYQYDLNYLKKYFSQWMTNYGNSCWMSIFFENHDNPRMISKVNPNPLYREVLAKLLAMIQFTLKGTPFIYQGQEIGSINKDFESIYEFRDIESINLYNELKETMSAKEAFKRILAGSRDHSRTPMQWNGEENAGFTTGIAWLPTDEDYHECNVELQVNNKQSVLNFYKELIKIRRINPALIYGDFLSVNEKKKNLFTYYRFLDNHVFYIECNLSDKHIKRKINVKEYSLIISNYENSAIKLRPYESNLYRISE